MSCHGKSPPGRVGREPRGVGLVEVSGAADGAPFAIIGQELLVELDRSLGRGHAERQVVGDVAALGHLDENLGCAYGVARGAATAVKDVLVVEQTGGKWTRAGRWMVPNRIEVRTKLCRVTFDFTDAVITSRTVRIDTDMQHGKLVIVGAPGIVIDADGFSLLFSKTKLCSDTAVTDPGLRIELVGTLKHAKVVERRP